MKRAYKILIVLMVLALSLAGCSTPPPAEKQGTMVITAFVDHNQNGSPDADDELMGGVQLAYGGFGSQLSDAQGRASFAVHIKDEATCLYLNEQKPITVLPPPGYVLESTDAGAWNCTQGADASFAVPAEDNHIYLRFVKPAEAPTPTQAAATLTPIPTPIPQPTQVPVGQPMPSMMIEAKTIPSTFSRTGLLIKFNYRITNTGNVTLTGPFTLKDLASDLSTIICTQYLTVAVLEPGKFIDCGGNRKSRLSDINGGVVGNVITISVTYTDPLSGGTQQVSAEAQTGSVYVKP